MLSWYDHNFDKISLKIFAHLFTFELYFLEDVVWNFFSDLFIDVLLPIRNLWSGMLYSLTCLLDGPVTPVAIFIIFSSTLMDLRNYVVVGFIMSYRIWRIIVGHTNRNPDMNGKPLRWFHSILVEKLELLLKRSQISSDSGIRITSIVVRRILLC